MPKACDNKSVGIIIEDERGRHALIFRKNYPKAWAPIAGHVDQYSSERDAMVAEAKEEGGLNLGRFVKVFTGDIDNPCKRPGGSHHRWTVYEAYEWLGTLRASSDAKEAKWVSAQDFKKLAARTEYFIDKFGVSCEEVGRLTKMIFGNTQSGTPQTDQEWEKDPGIEPVWYYIFKNLGKI